MKRSEKIRIGVSLLILAVSVTIVIVPLYLVVLNSFKPYSEIAKISALCQRRLRLSTTSRHGKG